MSSRNGTASSSATCWRSPRRAGSASSPSGRAGDPRAGVRALHEIGCTATLRQVSDQDDGRFNLVTVGADRFRLLGLDDSRAYLRAT